MCLTQKWSLGTVCAAKRCWYLRIWETGKEIWASRKWTGKQHLLHLFICIYSKSICCNSCKIIDDYAILQKMYICCSLKNSFQTIKVLNLCENWLKRTVAAAGNFSNKKRWMEDETQLVWRILGGVQPSIIWVGSLCASLSKVIEALHFLGYRSLKQLVNTLCGTFSLV